MDEDDLEVMSHVDPKEFLMTDEEVMKTSFTLTDNLMKPYDILLPEHRMICRENIIRILATGIALLEDYDKAYQN